MALSLYRGAMTELDPELMELVRTTPVETLEQLVLQYVRVRTEPDGIYVISDLRGNEIARLPRQSPPEQRRGRRVYPYEDSPAKAIAEALLSQVICGSCGGSLLAGEDGVCTLCEARQISELRRIAQDLSD